MSKIPKRRADAERSARAILEAAVRVLGARPDARLEDVAAAAGVSRQTVYAHFPSREALLRAVLEEVTRETVAQLDAAGLDDLPPTAALLRFVDVTWRAFERAPLLLRHASAELGGDRDHDLHDPAFAALERLVRRGQRSGELEPDLPAAWLVTAIAALGHAAGEEVAAGRLEPATAALLLRRSVLRLAGSSAVERRD